MATIRKFFRHVYFAIRHGDWSCGCEFYKNKPMLGVNCMYYDGNWVAFHFGPFWICCNF